MSTPTNKNAVRIPEASSDIGMGVAARGYAVSTVGTQRTFGAGDLATRGAASQPNCGTGG